MIFRVKFCGLDRGCCRVLEVASVREKGIREGFLEEVFCFRF